MRSHLVWVLAFAAGCNVDVTHIRAEPDATPPAPTAATDEGGPERPAPPPDSPAQTPVGPWASSSCGPRTYARHLTLEEGGAFVADDLVSPCPAGARCIWSGIVTRKGTWATSDGDLVLTVTEGAEAKQGQPLPAKLRWGGGAPEEVAPDGAKCPYLPR